MMKKILLLVFLLAGILQSYAQERSITGVVTSASDKSTLPGVNVSVKGRMHGTTTNMDGQYTLTVSPDDKVLIFSFVGMKTQEVTIGKNNTINVSLKSDALAINEVIVTAMGIKREKKALGYAVQDVKGSELVKSKESNIVNALNGKIAGVQITNSSGAPGASSQIIIRGGTSLQNDNQPLFVVDGIPIDNSTGTGGVGGSEFNGIGATNISNSNRAMDINPEDIESVSVLKGPAAAALYGLKAASGAIVITTKRGAKGQVKVSFGSKFSFDKVNKLPSQQDMYKQGPVDNLGNMDTRLSWGDKFGANEPIYNNLKNFFDDATSWEHNVSVSGATEKTSFYLSASNIDQTGIVPKTDYEKNSFRLNAEQKINEYISIGANANFISSNTTKTLTGSGLWGSSGGYMTSIMQWPRNDNMSNYLNPDGSKRRLLPDVDYFEDIDNPYWTVRNNPVTSKVTRFIGNIHTAITPVKWLSINYKLGVDYYNQFDKSVRGTGTSLKNWNEGGVAETNNEYQLLNSILMANIHKEVIPGLNMDLMVGHSLEITKRNANSWKGQDFIEPSFISINNTDLSRRDIRQSNTEKRLMGVFADFKVGYKNMLYAEFTGRNDWSSTLPIGNHSFFYPSASTGFIFSELLPRNNIFSYGKVRASWAQVGKDAPIYKTKTSFFVAETIGGGFKNSWTGGNPELKPETTTSYEFGADLRFFNGRLGMDFTYYNIKSEDQILSPRVSNATGYILKYVNAGTVENKGIELTLTANPIRTKNFRWDILANITKNKGKVKDLPGDLQIMYVTEAQVATGKAASFEDGAFLGISGMKWKTNDQGQTLIGSDGYPMTDTDATKYIGDREPDLSVGITNDLSYKNFRLSFLFDIRVGGDVFNATEHEMIYSGLSEETEHRGETKVFDGVVAQPDGSFVKNTQEVILNQKYYQEIYTRNAPFFIEEASWVRLRSLSLTYKLPQNIIRKTPFTNLDFTVTGRNLLLFTDYSGMDPEVSAGGAGVTGAGSSGIDYLGVPATKGLSLGIKANF